MDRFSIGTAEVLVGRGLPDPIFEERAGREFAAILHQPNSAAVAAEVGARMNTRCVTVEMPDREGAKTLESIGTVYNRLAVENLGRHDTIVGVGGGALTDAAGFVAATWMRGVELVLVPTTVLGAVDAAIGGKTAINVPGVASGSGKNLVGAFWLPSRVLVDLEVLEANPDQLVLEGTAEILKAGLIGDGAIVDLYLRYGRDAPLDDLVSRAIAVKTGIVSGDLREDGKRALLNLGHTVGHGLEAVTGMPHGHAVAIGMVAAGVISSSRYGFDNDWLTALIFSLGLPVAASGVSAGAVSAWVMRDKKRSAEGLRMVLLKSPGDVLVDVVTEEELALGLRSIGLV